MRALCLDIEGGFGGSSRSLYYILKHLPREHVQTTVWSKKAGPIQDLYAKESIPAQAVPNMPKVSSLPRFSRNVIVYSLFIREWLASKSFRETFYDALDTFDLVHFNHEALFWLARDMKSRKPKPATMHIRTNLWDSGFARWQCRIVNDSVDGLLFITENEQETFERHCGEKTSGHVLYNVAEANLDTIDPWPLNEEFLTGKKLLIGCLSNYSWYRGLDRIIELAEALKSRGRTDIGFVVAGDTSLTKSLPGALGEFGRAGLSLADYADHRGVSGSIEFLGHISEPERLLKSIDGLIKPTRENNPWGRDILEALAAGKPAFSVGRYDRFVETGVTGILQSTWDADTLASELARLADDRPAFEKMSKTATERIAELCDGRTQAQRLLDIWQGINAA